MIRSMAMATAATTIMKMTSDMVKDEKMLSAGGVGVVLGGGVGVALMRKRPFHLFVRERITLSNVNSAVSAWCFWRIVLLRRYLP